MSREYVLEPSGAPVNPQIDYAAELNEQQLAAVQALPGPALVIAGAGSGKTRTLTYRVAFLLEQGIPADRILLLTFTNKAAREMMRRVTDLLGMELPALWGGTFHSIGARLLRRHAEVAGFRPDFSILDREDSRELIKACLEDAARGGQATRLPKPDVLSDIYSMAVNTGRPIPEIVAAQYDYLEPLAGMIAELAKAYIKRKQSANVMDFDDLLTGWVRLMREHADVREYYQRRFQFLLVDEYQDTNTLQCEIIDLLAARHQNLMVVGDDAQSIYAWRGANFRNILDFPKRYPKARVYKIETNYRSAPEILSLANAAIAPNIHQFAKQLAPVRPPGAKPALVCCVDGSQEAAFVAQRVLQLHEEGSRLDQIAVLYRSHFHALDLQLELTRRHVPFSITSGIRFFEQAHVKDVTAYLRLLANPTDEVAFKRIVQLLPGIGGKGAQKLWTSFHASLPAETIEASDRLAAARGAAVPGEVEGAGGGHTGPARGELDAVALEAMDAAGQEPVRAPSAPPKLAPLLQGCSRAVPKKALKEWANLAITVSQLEQPAIRGSVQRMIQLILEAGYDQYLQDTFANYRVRLEDIEQLARFGLGFKSLEDFLTQLALLTNIEAEDSQAEAESGDKLRLSTVHQAKGLEFDIVFVINLCDGLFPSSRSVVTPEGEEEERRLLYVAITRARNELYLSFPLIHRGQGAMRPSRFLKEFDPSLVEEWNLRSHLM